MIKMLYVLPILIASLFHQDQNIPTDDTPLVPKVDELKLMRREQLKSILGSLLLERYLRPFDDWVADRGFVKEQMYNGVDDYNKELWFALVIKDGLEEPIWIKFHLHKTYEKHDLGFAASDLTIENHAAIIRRGLKASLEQNCIIHLDDKEVRKSIVFGTAHLYRLITKDSPIDKVRKEDLIY